MNPSQSMVEHNQLSVVSPKCGNIYENGIEGNIYKPTLSNMLKQVGKRSHLSIFIPKTCNIYYKITKEVNPYSENDDKHRYFRSSMNLAVITPNITNIEKIDNGVNIDINIENMSLETLHISEDYNDENRMTVYYTFGYGYVTEVLLCLNIDQNYKFNLSKELQFSYQKYLDTLNTLGFKKERTLKERIMGEKNKFLKPTFNSDETFVTDESIVHLEADLLADGFKLKYRVRDMAVHKNYQQILDSLNEQRMTKKYDVLNNFLK